MFRKENGVTLVALVITIIVLLILAGVTISMVLGDDGIVQQASDARAAQNKATVADQAAVAYATVRAEQIARGARVSTGTAITTSNFAEAMAVEMKLSKAFDAVKYDSNTIYVQLKGTKGTETYKIALTTSGTMTVLNANDSITATTADISALSDALSTY